MIAHHFEQQLDRFYLELQRLERKAAHGESFDPYDDFQGLVNVRNSLVFLKNLVRQQDFEPAECGIGTGADGSLYPVPKLAQITDVG